MSRVLYRKYRSQNFDEVIGQSHVTSILKNAVISDSLAHAYLFVGSRGTGKTSMARILAKAINCQNLGSDGNPCNECQACKSITEGNFLDLIEIDAASNRGIDQIRELKERIEFSPSEGKYKVYIIDEVHMLTKEAFNALLKTLEEPPAHVIFMLATTDVHKLPATILSRCQRYDLRLGSGDEIRKVLLRASDAEGVKVAPEAVDLLVESANGSYRDALSLLDVVVSGQVRSEAPTEVSENEVRQILGIPDSTMVYYLLEKIVKSDVKSALKLINELESKGVNLQQFVKYVLVMLRDILVGMATGQLDPTEYGFATGLNEKQVIALINGFLSVDRNLKNAHTPALMLEVFVVEQATVGYAGQSLTSPIDKSGGTVGGGTEVTEKGSAKVEMVKEKPAKTEKATVENSPVKAEKKDTTDEADQKGITIVVETQIENLDGSETVVIAEKDSKSEVIVEEQPVNEVVETVETNTSVPENISLKDVEDKWGAVIASAQKFNGHLYGFLKSAQIAEIKDGTLILHVPFEFHKERIEDPKTKPAIYESLKEALGFSMPFKCEVNASAKRKKKSSADLVLKSIQAAQVAIQSKPMEVKDSNAGGKPAGNGGENGGNGAGGTPRPVSKKVEALFQGM